MVHCRLFYKGPLLLDPGQLALQRGHFLTRLALVRQSSVAVKCVIPAPPEQQVRVDAELLGDLSLRHPRLGRQLNGFTLVLA